MPASKDFCYSNSSGNEAPELSDARLRSAQIAILRRNASRTENKIEGERSIEIDLFNIMIGPNKNDDGRIITKEDLHSFWQQPNRKRFLEENDWFDGKEAKSEDFLKIVSTLILARFSGWDRFKELFVDFPGRRDANLPFTKDDLKQNSFLGMADGEHFNDHQWVFCPLVIKARSKIYTLEPGRRLPFIEELDFIGHGATSEVFRTSIARNHLEIIDNSCPFSNTEVGVVWPLVQSVLMADNPVSLK